MTKLMIVFVVLAGFIWQGRLVESAAARASKPPRQRTVHIRGTIRDQNGNPVAGVTVTAVTSTP